MKRILIALTMVAGCGAGGDGASEEGGGETVRQAVQTAGLTGLYEGGATTRPDQMCVIDRGTGNAQFGLVVWGENLHSCSGAGQALREGNSLRLTMAGDESCTLDARIENGIVTLPATVPEGCSYYCGARARLGGAGFTKKGDTAEAAMQAKDLVGEPLCAGVAPTP